MAGPNAAGSRVIILASECVGMVSFPSKGQAVLVVHADAVAATLISLEGLQAVSRRAGQVREALGHVEPLQLPLDDRPEAFRDTSGSTARVLKEQVGRRLIGERLNHVLHGRRV